MKRVVNYIIVLLLVLCFIVPVKAKEDDKITLYLFYGSTCPHCKAEKEFLNKIKEKYDNFEIVDYEVYYNEENSQLMEEVRDKLGIKENGVPLTIIGKTYILGYSEALESKIERAINYYKENEYSDIVEKIKNKEFTKEEREELTDDFSKEEKKSDDNSTIEIPIFKKINLKNLSIASSAVIIGLIDGFNPCAMWILLFLISMLIGMKDRKRMWTLGIVFLTSSALVYMAIMMSWLNIVVKVSTSMWIRNGIAVVAIIGGLINLRSYIKSQDSGCSVVDDKKRKKIFERIKKYTHEKSFILAIIGVVALAVSVNIVELACSAGLPLIFTQLLSINNVTGLEAFLYTLLYIIFFLLDDLIIFFIAMFTMKVSGISTKYNKYSHLIGGILMVLVGVLLIFKPEWLTFGL